MSPVHPFRFALLGATLTLSLGAFGCSGESSPADAGVAGGAAAPVASRAPTTAPAPAAQGTQERAALTAAERQALVGWWLRYDQQYMIVIEAVAEDGRLEARYLNPDPVGVSKAEAWKAGERVELLLELTDNNYQGNFYELSFDPARQVLVGVYHHLGLKEDFEVDFTRFEDEKSEAVQPK
jgi:hypothetical protein